MCLSHVHCFLSKNEILYTQNLGQCCLQGLSSVQEKVTPGQWGVCLWAHVRTAFEGRDKMLLCNIWFPCKHEQSFWSIRNSPVIQLFVRRLPPISCRTLWARIWTSPFGDVVLGTVQSHMGVSELMAVHGLLWVTFHLILELIQSFLEQLYLKETLDPISSWMH